MSTMKNLIVDYDEEAKFRTILQDVPKLTAADLQSHEVLIKVNVAGCNPKDFKNPMPTFLNTHVNQGDDCAGTVVAVGSSVRGFSVGERVAGFHEMDTVHGTYAEYAICPATAVWRIPDSVSDEEAATMPVVVLTAAIGLYRRLQLPAPWDRSDNDIPPYEKIPLVINAASSAVGAFTIKLTKLNPKIGPIIATASSSANFVRSLSVDTVVDYRSPTIVEDIKAAADGSRSSMPSMPAIPSNPRSRFTGTGPIKHRQEFDRDGKSSTQQTGVWSEWTDVGEVHKTKAEGGILFGAVMSRVIEKMLFQGKLSGHPYEVVPKGLEGVKEALEELRDRRKGGNKKFVVRIADTPNI